ncbi:MAG: hypothetical protein K9K67_04115 [Bacteriovoracaceae bacterium]|nr:hypothetical protein [Bacteriovoracaceae bacterium]
MSLTKSFVILFFLAVMVFAEAKAEYRVYQFSVKARNPFSMDQKTHVVTSTLDPQSYVAYHGGETTLKIDLVRSWMCFGDTSNKQVCKPPIARAGASKAIN